MRRILSPLITAVACGCAALLFQMEANAQTRELATKGALLDRVAAVVNDGVVLNSELDDQIAIVSERLRAQKLELPPQNVLRQQVLERLVLQEIQAQRATKAGLKVPLLKDVLASLPVDKVRAQKIVTLLLRDRVLVKLADELVFHRDALDALRKQIVAQKVKTPKLNVGNFKDLFGVTRKHAIPLLEYLDRERVTRRVGDERVIL